MTDESRSKRNITPGKGDIYTFIDCEDRGDDGKKGVCFNESLPAFSCERFCNNRWCPRGYAR